MSLKYFYSICDIMNILKCCQIIAMHKTNTLALLPRINKGIFNLISSLPLNRPARLRSQVIEHPVHSFHLMSDPIRNMFKQLKRNILHRSRHGIHRIHCTQYHRISEGSRPIRHTDRPEIRHRRKILPNLTLKSVLRKFFPEDRI